MPKQVRIALLALLVSASSAAAQTAADSVLALNRSGQWERAARLALSSLNATASSDVRCGLRTSLVYALARLGMLEVAARELTTFDQQCADSPVARQQGPEIADLRRTVMLPPLPATGLDFTSVDHFWRIVETLQAGAVPTESDWHELLSSTGYRLALENVPTLREDITLAFSPTRRVVFDSLTKLRTDRAARLRHIARAGTLRPALDSLRTALARSTPVAEGVRGAARFLPAGATEGRDPPLVAVAIFNNDGYAGENAAIVDLLFVLDNGLVPLLSHEFHHSYGWRLSTVVLPPADSADAQLMAALSALRTEGIADLIDKPWPLTPSSPGMAAYVTRYTDVYTRTPEILRTLDSLLVVANERPSEMRAAGQRARALLWSNSHANGAFMARTIQETFGVDSLWAGVYSPFDFIRTFTAAERQRGRAPPFSQPAIAVLDALERKYRRR